MLGSRHIVGLILSYAVAWGHSAPTEFPAVKDVPPVRGNQTQPSGDNKENLEMACAEVPSLVACHRHCVKDVECHDRCPIPKTPFLAARLRKATECHKACKLDDPVCHRGCPYPLKDFVYKCKRRFADEAAPVRDNELQASGDDTENLETVCAEVPSLMACHRQCRQDVECHDRCPTPKSPGLAARLRKTAECHKACKLKVPACHRGCPSPLKKFVYKCKRRFAKEGEKKEDDDDEEENGEEKHDEEEEDVVEDDHEQEVVPVRDNELQASRDDTENLETVCAEIPSLMACHKQCRQDVECHDRCPTPKSPGLAARMRKAAECHKACSPDDPMCHRGCPYPLKQFASKCKGRFAEEKGPVSHEERRLVMV